jgi:hypothetical protein
MDRRVVSGRGHRFVEMAIKAETTKCTVKAESGRVLNKRPGVASHARMNHVWDGSEDVHILYFCLFVFFLLVPIAGSCYTR